MNLEQLQKQQKALATSINLDQKRSKELSDAINRMAKDMKVKEGEFENLNNKHEDLFEIVKEKKKEVLDIESTIREKKSKLSLVEEEAAGVEIELIEKKNKAEKELEINLDKINKTMVIANSDLLSKRDELTVVTSEVEKVKVEKEELQKSKIVSQEEVDVIKDKIVEEKNNLETVKIEEKNIKESIPGYQAQIDKIKNRIEEKSKELSGAFNDVKEKQAEKAEIVKEQKEETIKLEGMRGYRFSLARKGKELRKLFDILQASYKEANMNMPTVKWDITIPQFEDLDEDNIPKSL